MLDWLGCENNKSYLRVLEAWPEVTICHCRTNMNSLKGRSGITQWNTRVLRQQWLKPRQGRGVSLLHPLWLTPYHKGKSALGARWNRRFWTRKLSMGSMRESSAASSDLWGNECGTEQLPLQILGPWGSQWTRLCRSPGEQDQVIVTLFPSGGTMQRSQVVCSTSHSIINCRIGLELNVFYSLPSPLSPLPSTVSLSRA